MNEIITGKVIQGKGYGRKIGFPTLNLEGNDQKIPDTGIYSGEVTLEGKIYQAGVVVENGKIEAHLIGYDGDAYGKTVTLEIKKFLREFKKFETEEELTAQIKEDIKLCSQA